MSRIVACRDAFFSFPALNATSSSSSLPCTILLSQHKWAQMISGATALPPKLSSVDPKLLKEAAKFVAALNSTHAARPISAMGAPAPFRFVMEFITNRACPQVDVSAIPEGILLVSRDNWEEAMGPVFGTRNLKHHVDVQQTAMEQQQQLQASGGFLFPPAPFADALEPTTCACVGDCSATAACPCMLGHSPCNSSCHRSSASGLLQASLPSHSQCKNPLNAAIPVSAPLQQAPRGQAGCRCTTGCASVQCGCRKRGLACTTACHGFNGHENCTNRTAPLSVTEDKKPKKRAAEATEKSETRKKAKAAAVASTADDEELEAVA